MDQCLVGKRALLVIQDGSWYFPAIMRKVYKGSTFGQTGDFADAEANYRELKKQAGQPGKPSLVVMPLVPYDPTGDSTNPGSEALVVNEEGLVCEADGKPYSGLASRLHKDEEALPHISYKFRKGKKVDRATGWAGGQDGSVQRHVREQQDCGGTLQRPRHQGGFPETDG